MSRSVEEMWQYWADPNTRDLIQTAQPLDMILGIGGDGRKEELHDELRPLGGVEGGRVTTVDDDKLTSYPYQSVGRLFWCKPSSRVSITWTSAFYIGNNTIMTAAHAFDDAQHKYGVFVPAMINKDDFYGKHYGCFLVDPNSGKSHPSYVPYNNKTGEPITPQYDICTVVLGQTCFKKIEEENLIQNMTIDRAGLKQITCYGNIVPNRDTTWIVLGYPCEGGKLTEVIGKYYEQPNIDQVAMDIEVRPGMSGGPWIPGDTIGSDATANGCQAAAKSRYSVSPYFSSKLFDKLERHASK